MLFSQSKAALTSLLLAGVFCLGGQLVHEASAGKGPQVRSEAASFLAGLTEERTRVDAQGDPLPADARARLGTMRLRHNSGVDSMAFAPDGKHLVSHADDGLRVWDTATGRQVGQVLEGDGPCYAGFVNNDGKTLITLEDSRNIEKLIRLRDLTTLQVLHAFEVGYLKRPRLSPDGKLLAGLDENYSTVEIWDTIKGIRLRSWKAHEGEIRTYEFSADSKSLVTGGPDHVIRFWDVATGAEQREIGGIRNDRVKLALSPDGTFLVALETTAVKTSEGRPYSCANLLRVWDVVHGKELEKISLAVEPGSSGDPQEFNCLAFARDGKTLVTAGEDEQLRFWDPATAREVRRFSSGCKDIKTLAFAPDGKSMAVGANSIRLFDLASGRELLPFVGHQSGICATAITPDGRTIATESADGTVLVWDATKGRERTRLERHKLSGTGLTIMGDGRRLLTSSEEVLWVWELPSGKELQRIALPKPLLKVLAISADSGTVVVAGKDRGVSLINLATGKNVLNLLGPNERAYGATFFPGGQTLLVWYEDHTAHVWNLQNAREIRQFRFADPPSQARVQAGAILLFRGLKHLLYGAAASPDGSLIAYGNLKRYLVLYETESGKQVRSLTDLGEIPVALAFSPDQRMVAWAGWRDPTIHLIEVLTGSERKQLLGHTGPVNSLSFSADGKTLISGSDDTTAIVWDLIGTREEGIRGTPPDESPRATAKWTR